MKKHTANPVLIYLKKTDMLLWLSTLTAAVYGFLLIASLQRNGGPDFLKTQIIAVFIGYIAAVTVSLVDYEHIAKKWLFIAAAALAMTFSVFFIGIQVAGTDDAGWIRLPGGMTFQPSELTKICFIITYSKHLAVLDENGRLRSFFGVMSLVFHAMVPIVLIHFQGDDGAALVFAFMFLIMSFIAGIQIRYFVITGTVLTAALPLIWSHILNDDQKNRFAVLLSSDDSSLRTYGWQQYQGKVSIASGGIFGKGLLKGTRVEDNAVPFQENDFIFTVAGEELGFIGCFAIILLFGVILFRVIRISSHAGGPLGRNICIGFFALIAVQFTINIGMVLGLLPVAGVTLPFLSSGGTSAACLYIGIGLVQSVRMHPASGGVHTLSNFKRRNFHNMRSLRTPQGSPGLYTARLKL